MDAQDLLLSGLLSDDPSILNQSIATAISGANRTRSNPYTVPRIATGMDSATAELSAQAAQNPFAIGHAMNAQLQSAGAAQNAVATNKYFGDLNAEAAGKQAVYAREFAIYEGLVKNLHMFADRPELFNSVVQYLMGRANDFGYSPEMIEELALNRKIDSASNIMDVAKTGQETGIDTRSGALKIINKVLPELATDAEMVAPLSVRAGAAGGGQNKLMFEAPFTTSQGVSGTIKGNPNTVMDYVDKNTKPSTTKSLNPYNRSRRTTE